MSLLRSTIEAFPRGRTTGEILVLLDADFDHQRRASIIAELDELASTKIVARGRDGRWRSLVAPMHHKQEQRHGDVIPRQGEVDPLVAAPARFRETIVEHAVADAPDIQGGPIDPKALLRYWRSALRADPRGAITQMPDQHGVDWHLISGSGPVAPNGRNSMSIRVPLDDLAEDFRKALQRRQDKEMSFAVGWPIAVGRRSGVPAIWPVGLLAAEWRRSETHLEISVESEDTLINPDWLRHGARDIGWRQNDLREVFAGGGAT